MVKMFNPQDVESFFTDINQVTPLASLLVNKELVLEKLRPNTIKPQDLIKLDKLSHRIEYRQFLGNLLLWAPVQVLVVTILMVLWSWMAQ